MCYLSSSLIQVYVSQHFKTDLRKTVLISPKYKWLIPISPLPKSLALLFFFFALLLFISVDAGDKHLY